MFDVVSHPQIDDVIFLWIDVCFRIINFSQFRIVIDLRNKRILTFYIQYTKYLVWKLWIVGHEPVVPSLQVRHVITTSVLNLWKMNTLFHYRLSMKLLEGNVFTLLCLSAGRALCPHGGRCEDWSRKRGTPWYWHLLVATEAMVCILLECAPVFAWCFDENVLTYIVSLINS